MKKNNTFMLVIIVLAVSCVAMIGASPLFADSYTTLMLHSDEADGSTTFTDSSGIGYTIYTVGNTHHETDKAKFGQSSVYFGAQNDYMYILDNDNLDFGTGNFTVDFWINATSINSNATIIDKMGSGKGWLVYIDNLGRLKVMIYPNEGGVKNVGWAYQVDLADGNWHHVAVARNNGTGMLFMDGTNYLSGDLSGDLDNSGSLKIGWDILNGYIDELRVSKGIARWTDNFTPHPSQQAFEDIDAGVNSLGLEYSAAEKEQLYQLYEDGKDNLNPENITINGTTWQYYDGELPGQAGHSIGDAYEYNGKQYIYLGSGLEGGGGAPELPAGAIPFLGTILGFFYVTIRRSRN